MLRKLVFAACTVLTVCIAVLERILNLPVPLAPLYAVPVCLLAWFLSFWPAFAAALVAPLVEVWARSAAPGASSSILFQAYPFAVLFLSLVLLVLLITRLKLWRRKCEQGSRTDTLTGAMNSRSFYEVAGVERERALRNLKPFTLAYLDVDNLRFINEQFGHGEGDRVLKILGEDIRATLRVMDSVGRLAGDEFALLLPDSDYSSSDTVLQRIRERIKAAAARNGWPLTLSMGAVTFHDAPEELDEMIRLADELASTVKARGKDGVIHIVHSPAHSVTVSTADEDVNRDVDPALVATD